MRARLVLLFFVAAGGMLLAQDPAQEPAPPIRTGVDLIRVDVYPSRDGTPVTDLRADEFAVFEDGVRQAIESFERVTVPSGGAETARVEPESIAAGRQMIADPRVRVFVVFIDTYHMDPQASQQARGPIRDFLERALGPDDLVAVMTPEMDVDAMTFTRRTTVLAGLLDNPMPWLIRDALDTPTDDVEAVLRECFSRGDYGALVARHREKRTLDRLEDLAFRLGTLRDERKTVLLVSSGWTLYEPAPNLVGPRETNPNLTFAEGSLCDAERLRLLSLDHSERLREITGEANRGNVSFYPVSPLRNSAFSAAGRMPVLSTLRELAEETDGIAIVNTNTIDEPVRRLIADTSHYYLLGYASTNTKQDGGFRRIRVDVTRPGVEVRARRGYRAGVAVARSSSAVTRATPAGDPAMHAAMSAVASSSETRPLRVRVSGWQLPDGRSELWITGELDITVRRGAEWASGAVADVMLLGGDAGLRERVPVADGTGVFDARLERAGPLAPGEYQARVTVRASSGTTMTETAKVVLSAAADGAGMPRLFRRGPTTGNRHQATADVRFRRNEQLRLELPAEGEEAGAARLVDRVGATLAVPPQVTVRPATADTAAAMVVDLPLAPLAAGDYAVVVARGGREQVIGFRIVP